MFAPWVVPDMWGWGGDDPIESSVMPPRALTTHPTGVTLGCLFPREGPAASAAPLRLVVKAMGSRSA